MWTRGILALGESRATGHRQAPATQLLPGGAAPAQAHSSLSSLPRRNHIVLGTRRSPGLMPLAFCKDQEMQTGPTRASPTGIFHIPNATEELPIGSPGHEAGFRM